MKVKLASQLLSESVADALEFCDKALNNLKNVKPLLILLENLTHYLI